MSAQQDRISRSSCALSALPVTASSPPMLSSAANVIDPPVLSGCTSTAPSTALRLTLSTFSASPLTASDPDTTLHSSSSASCSVTSPLHTTGGGGGAAAFATARREGRAASARNAARSSDRIELNEAPRSCVCGRLPCLAVAGAPTAKARLAARARKPAPGAAKAPRAPQLSSTSPTRAQLIGD